MRVLIAFAILIGLVVGGFIIVPKFLRPGTPVDTGKGKLAVTTPTEGYVAAVDLPAYGVVSSSSVLFKVKPDGFPKEIVTDPKELEGMVLNDQVRAGEPILKTNSPDRLRKVKPAIVEQARSAGRLLIIPNAGLTVTFPAARGVSFTLAPGMKLKAEVGLAAARPAALANAEMVRRNEESEAKGKATEVGKTAGAGSAVTESRSPASTTSSTSSPRGTAAVATEPPAILTIMFINSDTLGGTQFWDTRPGADSALASGGGDLLVAASPADALRLGNAIRDKTIQLSVLDLPASIIVKASPEQNRLNGLRLMDINEVARRKYDDELRKAAEADRKAREDEEDRKFQRQMARQAAMAAALTATKPPPLPPPVPIHGCGAGNPRCGYWEMKTEPVDREVEVYRGRELVKMKISEGTRTVREWRWNVGHGGGGPAPLPAPLR